SLSRCILTTSALPAHKQTSLPSADMSQRCQKETRAPHQTISIRSDLFQTYRYPAHCSRHFSADLWAAELQDHAIGILQLNASSPSRNRTTGSDRAESAFNRSRL